MLPTQQEPMKFEVPTAENMKIQSSRMWHCVVSEVPTFQRN